MKKLLLIDGNSMLFRAYYGTLARGTMTSSSGVTTNAVYGFSTMLKKAIEMMQPTHILVAFDTGDKTFRHDMCETYKGTRKEVDYELVSQFELIREFLDAYPIQRYELSGYEADDIIGTLARNSVDYHVEILTSDRDMLQLIDDHVDVLLMKKGLTDIKLMDIAELQAEMGIRPDQIVDVKALMGDPSDNIPGIPSVGEKTALKFIKEYGSFENFYAHKDEIKGKVGEKVREFEDQARMSYKLSKIYCDVALDFDMNKLVYEIPNDTLNAFYRKYDMNSLITTDVEVVEVKKVHLKQVPFEELATEKSVALHLDQDKKGKILGVFCASDGFVAYLSYLEMQSDSKFHALLAKDDLLCSSSKLVYHFAMEHKIEYSRSYNDVLLLSFIIDSSVTTMEKMKDKYDLWFHEYEGEELGLAFANALESLFTQLLEEANQLQVEGVYNEIEKPLAVVLAEIESNGIRVEKDVLDNIAHTTLEKIDGLSAQIYDLVGHEFNLNSPKQMAEALFDTLEIPSAKKRSTAVDVLDSLKDEYPIMHLILEYRKYQKLYSTYAVGLVKHIQDDGKIHTVFNQHLAQTGRLSSTEPNLQNISVRDEETKVIRSAFVPSKGRKFVSIDYSQIELRILAFMADEEQMIETFNSGEDIHVQTAAKIFNEEHITSEMRRQAKSVNFGIIYGMSGFGLAKQLDISIKDASSFIDKYNEVYPNISKYMNKVISDCERDGFVSTVFNRRRYIPEIHSTNRAVKEFGKRAAMNAPIQGTAADIIKLAMIKAQDLIRAKGYQSKMLLQVHDELLFDVLEGELDHFVADIKDMMESIVSWPVKLKVSVEVADNWMGE